MNKVILLGRLTKAPEIRFSQKNNVKFAHFTLAVNRKYVAQGKERQTDFINIVTISKLADFAEQYLKQGLQICLCGRIQTRNWEDENGKKHYATEVTGEEIYFVDNPKKTAESILNSNTASKVEKSSITSSDCEVIGDNDLPF